MDEERDISKSLWNNPFAVPAADALVAELDEGDRDSFTAVGEALGGRDGWKATLAWQGLPWRWAMAYQRSGDEQPALAYQIPDPRGSRVCVPVPAYGPGAPDVASLTKPVRTLIERSAIIAGYIWVEWPSGDFDPVAAEPLLSARSGGEKK